MATLAIPLCNAEAFIGDTLRSLLCQTFDDFEILVSENRSDDRSLAIVKEFHDPRIRILETGERVSMEENWNRCLEAARGRYVKIVCADDLIAPDCLRQQVGALEDPGSAGAGVACCARSIIDACGRRRGRRGYPGPPGRVPGPKAFRRILLRGTNLLGEPAAVLFRADVAGRSMRFRGDHPYAIDVDFWLRLLARSDLVVLGEELASFRVSAGSATARTGWAQYRDFKACIRRAALENPGLIRRGDLARSAVGAALHTLARIAVVAMISRPSRA